MGHVYSDEFFDYIDAESLQSAERVITTALAFLTPRSVLDVGCGRGAWLRHWHADGGARVTGIDGAYVDLDRLHFPKDGFVARDLSRAFDLDRKFDLVQSLEVAEHLPPESSDAFVSSLCAHGDIVLFSAAVPGQGGEHHVNERPLEFWRDRFAARSYRCFDCIRPKVLQDRLIKPWYRYNTLLYVHERRVASLPEDIRRTEIPAGRRIPDPAPIGWRLRKALVATMPRSLVTLIARANAWRIVGFGPRRAG